MTPDSHDRDFYEADVPTDANPSRLREVILAQALEPGGAAVVLFTSATLAAGTDDRDPVDPAAAERVVATAHELGMGVTAPALFSADAYVLQSALGSDLLPEGA